MFESLWVILVSISLLVSLGAFFWGLSAGQFSSPERARYLPFNDREPGPEKKIGREMKIPLEVYVLGGIVCLSLMVLAAPVILTLYHILARWI